MSTKPGQLHFAGLKFGDNVVQGAGIGIMVGLAKKKGIVGGNANYFNVGVGWMWELGVQTLEDGFEKNRTAPAGAKEVALQRETDQGFLLMFSFRAF